MNQDQTVKTFRALSDKTRLQVLRIIETRKEISCQELQKRFKLSQPTLSHHFNKLIDAKIITYRKDGVSNFYKLNHDLFREIGINLKILLKNR